jgi:hypothetical protein
VERTAEGFGGFFLRERSPLGLCFAMAGPRRDGMPKRILLVGHCGVDGPRLKDELSRALPGTHVERINSDEDLREAVGKGADLLLVNREPVGFESGGIAIIRQVKKLEPKCKVMLVSDYDDAQEEAKAAGALPGFGKSEMGSARLAEHVRAALDRAGGGGKKRRGRNARAK